MSTSAARSFGREESGMINAVLDGLAREFPRGRVSPSEAGRRHRRRMRPDLRRAESADTGLRNAARHTFLRHLRHLPGAWTPGPFAARLRAPFVFTHPHFASRCVTMRHTAFAAGCGRRPAVGRAEGRNLAHGPELTPDDARRQFYRKTSILQLADRAVVGKSRPG